MRQLYLKAQTNRQPTLAARIRACDAALRIVSKDPRTLYAQERLRMRRAHLIDRYLASKGFQRA